MDSATIPVEGWDGGAIVDKDDEGRVAQHRWQYQIFKDKPVPVTRIDGRYVRLNRFVLGSHPGDGFMVKPKNGDYFDCRKTNLERLPSPINPTKSWEKRKNRAESPPRTPRIEEPRTCPHPIFVPTDRASIYRCVRCDQEAAILVTSLP